MKPGWTPPVVSLAQPGQRQPRYSLPFGPGFFLARNVKITLPQNCPLWQYGGQVSLPPILPTVTPEQIAKIEAGVAACLERCQNPTRMYSGVAAFIEGLKADPAWTAAELIELQTRVIRILLQRHHGDDPTP
jgi:hypothetical protein